MSIGTLARRRQARPLPGDVSPWVPPPGVSLYDPPQRTIDPDRRKTWLRRARPLVMAHKGMFITSLVMSFVGLVLQVEIPQLLGTKALDSAIVPFVQQSSKPVSQRLPASHYQHILFQYVGIVLVLAVLAGICGYVSRLLLMKTAYQIEFDLRNIIYTHLSRMSF